MIPSLVVTFVVDFIAFLVAYLEIRRENSVDHIELVLQSAILFLQYPDSIEQFLFGRHDPIVTRDVLVAMGFALWIDASTDLAWAQGTHEYRPMGTAVIARTGQFRRLDFRQTRRRPAHLENSFAGFYGSLEDVNRILRAQPRWRLRWTPGHLR